jgi:hypothetical protein
MSNPSREGGWCVVQPNPAQPPSRSRSPRLSRPKSCFPVPFRGIPSLSTSALFRLSITAFPNNPSLPSLLILAGSELVLASPSSCVPASLLRLPESHPSSNVDKGRWVTSVAGRRRLGRHGDDMAGSAFGLCANSPRPRYSHDSFSFSAVIHKERHSSPRRMRAG